jgi:monoamine oxidase
MAGAAAAYWLRKAGISALVLEARDRIGGRLWTSMHWKDAPLDLGGAWITEAFNSPLMTLAKNFNIKTQFTDFYKVNMFLPNGTQYTPEQVVGVFGLYSAVFGQVYLDRKVLEARGFPDRTLQSAVDKVLASLKLTPKQMNDFNALVEGDARSHFAAELRNLSLYYFDQDINIWPADDHAFPKGYVQLVQALLGNTPVLHNQVIKSIQYGPQGVTVCTNGSQYSAKYALVTMSIGVLKSADITFKPLLPDWKRGAISRLGMGNVNKLMLRFPRAFWVSQAPAQQPNFLFRVAPQLGQYVAWFNTVPLTGQPVLGAFVCADTATKTESMSDAELVNTLVTILRQWYGPRGVRVPDPVDFQRSRWMSDPFARGAYSNIPLGSSGIDYDLMALPVTYVPNLPATANRLFFAGEGTDRLHPATALGAYNSGKREASRIAQMRVGSYG